MQFEFTDPQTELERLLGGYFCINAFGRVDPGDDAKFKEFIEKSGPPPRTPVFIDSIGGDVEAAIGIGRVIRECWFSTHIGSCHLSYDDTSGHILKRQYLSGRCMSAATLIFLGGRLRYVDNNPQFGVHRFSFRDPTPDHLASSQVLSAKIASYVVDMGISPEFLEVSSSIEKDQIRLLDAEELHRLKIATGGQTDVTWSTQSRSDMLYVRGERDSLYGHHKVMLGFTRRAGFFFWAVVEAQGREEELTTFPLVEIVVNEEDTKFDVSETSVRFVEGIYVNVFANLTQEQAREVAHSDSFGVQIRMSHDAPVFLGVGPMNTSDGKEQLESFFATLCDSS